MDCELMEELWHAMVLVGAAAVFGVFCFEAGGIILDLT